MANHFLANITLPDISASGIGIGTQACSPVAVQSCIGADQTLWSNLLNLLFFNEFVNFKYESHPLRFDSGSCLITERGDSLFALKCLS